ncbi:MAG: GNAT family N-acetyltransferase [Pseudomonadota bacterium]
MQVFADAFEDEGTYLQAPPENDYLAGLLAREDFIALAAETEGAALVGGLTAYILKKPEQMRSEVYIYDLAVAAHHRREGIATRLIGALKPIARAAGAWVIYVQADDGDRPAVALYEKCGRKQAVLHFDIPVE